MVNMYATFTWLAGLFSTVATVISLLSMWHHLKQYHQPGLQRWVIRLLWMTPIYAITSWISLQSLDAAYYLDTVRDLYEGFVIYSFFNLLVNYLGGERSLLIMLHNRPPTPHFWPVSLWCQDMVVGDPFVFLFLKRGILQYVYVKPVLAAATMLLKSNHAYADGDFSLTNGYFWVSFVYNISVSLCLYCLAIFFMATKDDLQPFRPFPKFLCVKAVIFFSFWQGLFISFLVSVGLIHATDTFTAENMAVFAQDWLICLEMVFAAVGHWYSFTYRDFIPTQDLSARMRLKYAFRDAIGVKDIIVDSVDTYTGHGFNYRAFDPVETAPYTPGERGQLRPGDANRLMAGMRYSRGGQVKYWLPVDNQPGTLPSDRTPLLSANKQPSMPSVRPGLYATDLLDVPPPWHSSPSSSQTSTVVITSTPTGHHLPIFQDLTHSDNQTMDTLYALAMELPPEGDSNYPVIDTSRQPRAAYTPASRARRHIHRQSSVISNQSNHTAKRLPKQAQALPPTSIPTPQPSSQSPLHSPLLVPNEWVNSEPYSQP